MSESDTIQDTYDELDGIAGTLTDMDEDQSPLTSDMLSTMFDIIGNMEPTELIHIPSNGGVITQEGNNSYSNHIHATLPSQYIIHPKYEYKPVYNNSLKAIKRGFHEINEEGKNIS